MILVENKKKYEVFLACKEIAHTGTVHMQMNETYTKITCFLFISFWAKLKPIDFNFPGSISLKGILAYSTRKWSQQFQDEFFLIAKSISEQLQLENFENVQI